MTHDALVQELYEIVKQWQGQTITIENYWPPSDVGPGGSFTGTVVAVTTTGMLISRELPDPDGLMRRHPPAVRVFLAWTDIGAPRGYTLTGTVRYRLSHGAWSVESPGHVFDRWWRRYQAAIAEEAAPDAAHA